MAASKRQSGIDVTREARRESRASSATSDTIETGGSAQRPTVSINDQRAPRLPHERDEGPPRTIPGTRRVVKQAARDLAHGLQDTSRNAETSEVARKLRSDQ